MSPIHGGVAEQEAKAPAITEQESSVLKSASGKCSPIGGGVAEQEAKAPATTEQESSALKSTVTALEKHHDAAFMQVESFTGMSKGKGDGKTPWRSFDGPTGSGKGFRLNVESLAGDSSISYPAVASLGDKS